MQTPKFDSKNPHFNNRFASLGEVTRVAKEALLAQGIVLTQPCGIGPDGTIGVSTVLRSGDEVLDLGTIAMLMPADPQKIGSAITYFRRYSLAAALALVADEDDDAEAASTPPAPPARPKPAAKAALANDGQRKKVFATLREKGLTTDQIRAFAVVVTEKEHSAEWTSDDITHMLETAERPDAIRAFAEMDPVLPAG